MYAFTHTCLGPWVDDKLNIKHPAGLPASTLFSITIVSTETILNWELNPFHVTDLF